MGEKALDSYLVACYPIHPHLFQVSLKRLHIFIKEIHSFTGRCLIILKETYGNVDMHLQKMVNGYAHRQ